MYIINILDVILVKANYMSTGTIWSLTDEGNKIFWQVTYVQLGRVSEERQFLSPQHRNRHFCVGAPKLSSSFLPFDSYHSW